MRSAAFSHISFLHPPLWIVEEKKKREKKKEKEKKEKKERRNG